MHELSITQGILDVTLDAARKADASLMPLFVYATLGEICNTLRGVFGEYRP